VRLIATSLYVPRADRVGLGDAVDETMNVVGMVGGGLGALACLVAAIIRFRNDRMEQGIGLLVLAPVAYFVVFGLIYLVVALAVIAFVGWVFVNWLNE
jgi:hypothetical protein